MQICITSENSAKVRAVQDVFQSVFGAVVCIGKKFPSLVREQPLSEEEGIQGTLNRARGARSVMPEMGYCVGMEGYVETNTFGMFLGGAVVVIDSNECVGIGISAKVRLPDHIQKKLEAGIELGPYMQECLEDMENTVRHHEGTNGILTNGLYTRVDEFKDATVCALAPFRSPTWYATRSR
jgi:inosine/xanthosine triphosphatase